MEEREKHMNHRWAISLPILILSQPYTRVPVRQVDRQNFGDSKGWCSDEGLENPAPPSRRQKVSPWGCLLDVLLWPLLARNAATPLPPSRFHSASSSRPCSPSQPSPSSSHDVYRTSHPGRTCPELFKQRYELVVQLQDKLFRNNNYVKL